MTQNPNYYNLQGILNQNVLLFDSIGQTVNYLLRLFLSVDDCSSDSYVGRDDFFFLFFKFRFIFFVKRKANSTIEQRKCKDH